MLRLVADENFHGPLLRALRLRCPEMDVVRVVDSGLSGISDPDLLTWAAEHERVILTHDAATMAGFAYDRVHAAQPMPGIIEVKLGGENAAHFRRRAHGCHAGPRGRDSAPCAVHSISYLSARRIAHETPETVSTEK